MNYIDETFELALVIDKLTQSQKHDVIFNTNNILSDDFYGSRILFFNSDLDIELKIYGLY